MNNSTKERKFLADNALLFFHPQVYDFLIHKDTVRKSLTGMAVLEAEFRRNPLRCLNELRLTSSLNEAQDNLP